MGVPNERRMRRQNPEEHPHVGQSGRRGAGQRGEKQSARDRAMQDVHQEVPWHQHLCKGTDRRRIKWSFSAGLTGSADLRGALELKGTLKVVPSWAK